MTPTKNESLPELPAPLHSEHGIDRVDHYYTAEQMVEYARLAVVSSGGAALPDVRGPIDVLAVLDRVAKEFEWEHEGVPVALSEIRAVIFELIEADKAFTVALEKWNHGSLPFLAYQQACVRRALALDYVQSAREKAHDEAH